MNTKDISEARDPLLPASLAAMERAAEQARRCASITKTRLVAWRCGTIRHIDPSAAGTESLRSNVETEHDCAAFPVDTGTEK